MKKFMQYRFKVLRGLFPYTNGIQMYWGILLCSGLFAVGMELATPSIYKFFINDVILQKKYSLLSAVILAYISVFVCGTIFGYIKNFAQYKLINTIMLRVREKILQNYLDSPFEAYENMNIGDRKLRMDEDVEQIRELVGAQTIDYIVQCLTAAVCTYILFSINWIIAVFSIVAIPLTFFLDYVFSKMEMQSVEGRRINQKNTSTWMHASIQGWREVKALNLSKRETRIYYRFLHREMLLFARWINYWTTRALIIPTIKNQFFMQFGLYLIGGLLIISGKLNIGSLLVFAVYYNLLSNAVENVSTANADLQTMKPYLDRLMESLSAPDAKKAGGIVPDDSNAICLEDVSFSYPNSDKPVIEGMNLVINRGERVAITGKSGSGKTTLLKLITGMVKPTGGHVLFSGVDLNEIDIEEMHRRIGFVMQENILFHTSIRENLLFGKNDATDEELLDACKKACIYDFIMETPDGLDTMIGEKGIKLSGGQRQRMILARLFLQDIDIFIFDEATSALDQYSENIVHDAIRNIAEDKTIIVVAHRESSIQLCDRIVRIDGAKA